MFFYYNVFLVSLVTHFEIAVFIQLTVLVSVIKSSSVSKQVDVILFQCIINFSFAAAI